MAVQFRKNLHIAKRVTEKMVKQKIKNYPSQYPTPKYLGFMKKLIKKGYCVKIYVAKTSKYIFAERGNYIAKIRFSDHKPNLYREIDDDCDYYVGRSNFQVSTTNQVIRKIGKAYSNHLEYEQKKSKKTKS